MTTTPHPMTRAEWSVAWRFARRLFRSRGAAGELAAMDAARAELGRPLPLRFGATSTATLGTGSPGESWTCPRCGAVTYNAKDIGEGYCGRCHDWTREPQEDEVLPPAPRSKGREMTDLELARRAARAQAAPPRMGVLPLLVSPRTRPPSNGARHPRAPF